MKCRVHGGKVVRWTTRDGTVVTPAPRMQVCDARRITGDDDNATDALAAFRAGCRVQCRCMNEDGCSPEDCDALYVFDAAGTHIATMHGKWKPEVLDNGNIGVCRVPTSTGDAALDGIAPPMSQDLARINAANADFWKPKEEKPCQQR